MVEVQHLEVIGAGDVVSVLDVLVERLGLRVDLDEDVTRVALDSADGVVGGSGSVLEHRIDASGSASLVWLRDGRTVCRVDDVTRDVPSTVDGFGLPPKLTDVVGGVRLRASGPTRSRIVALSRTDDEDKTTVRLVVDRTLDDRGSALPIIIDVLPLRGYRREAERLVDDLCGSIALRSSMTGSSDRARPRGRGLGAAPWSMTAVEGWRVVLRDLTASMTDHFSGVLTGEDPEDLHAFRVAVRRIRTLLRDGAGVLSSPERDRFRTDFLWLGEVTTPTRDADVHVLELPTIGAALPDDLRGGLEPLLDVLVAHRADVHDEMVRTMRSMRRAEFGMAWATWLADDARWTREVAPQAGDRVTDVAAAAVRDAHRRLVRDGRAVEESSPPFVLHDLRKDAKRLRYLLECFAPLFDPDAVEVVTTRLRKLQDALGIFQDAAVQAGELRLLVTRGDNVGPDVLRTVSGVIEHLDEASEDARRRVDGLFERFDGKKVRRAIGGIDRSMSGRKR